MVKSTDFIKALTIKERVSLLDEYQNVFFNTTAYSNWVNIRGVVKESDIINYYKLDSISPEQLAKVIDISDDDCSINNLLSDYVSKTEWFKDFVRIVSKTEGQYITDLEYDVDLGFFVLPFVLHAGDVLGDRIQKIESIKISHKVLQSMLEKISSVLVNLGIKTFVWEYRSTSQSENTNDNDACQTVSLEDYLRNLTDVKKIVALYSKYPVIMRRVVVKTRELIDNYLLLINRVESDICEIERLLNNKITEWEDIDSDQGDTHEKGNFVSKLKFNCGFVIYKPRNLKIQEKFYSFVERITDKEEKLLKTSLPKTIYHEKYTWDGFVTNNQCKSIDEVKRFYIRFGQMCAFVFLLRGNDIHYENIIADGEYPVLIDVETLFQNLSDTTEFQPNAASDVYKECMDSVGGTAMVPIIAFSKNESSKGIDISALGGRGQELPYKVLQLVEANTDAIRFEDRNATMDDAHNLPLYEGEEIDFREYVDEILLGFENVMKFAVNYKDTIIDKEDGLLNIFKGVEERHLMRATQNYAKMMSFSSHPNYSQDMVLLERMLINVWSYPYYDKRIVKNEVMDMMFGDIPIFFGKVDSRDIWSSDREEVIRYFDETMFNKVYKRITQLTEREIQKQISQMRVCMGLFTTDNITRINCHKTELNEITITNKRVLKCVERIADEIVDDAIVNVASNTIEWCNVFYDNVNNCWKTRGIGCGFVHGSAGVLVFMHFANKILKKYDDYIVKMVGSIVSMPGDRLPIALGDGLAANIYALLLLYKDTKAEELKQAMYYLIGMVKERYGVCSDVSLMYGLSGVALVISECWKEFGDEYIKGLLNELVNKILLLDDPSEESFYEGRQGVFYALKKVLENGIDAYNSEIKTLLDNNIEGYKKIDFRLGKEKIDEVIVPKVFDNNIAFSGGLSGELYKLIKLEELADSAILDRTIMKIVYDIENQKMTFPSEIGYKTVGFMYGLAGIGYSLLKYLNPDIEDVPLFG